MDRNSDEITVRSWAKLDSGITQSSLWMEDHVTLRVWIAFLSSCDKEGYVRVSDIAMAHICLLGLEEFLEVIKTLVKPDPNSRCSRHDGRRIERVEGGYVVLNYTAYRDSKGTSMTNAERQKRFREKNRNAKSNVTSNGESNESNESNQDVDVDVDVDVEAAAQQPAQAEIQIQTSQNIGAPKDSSACRHSPSDSATSSWMFDLLRETNPKHKKPNLDRWAEDVRKIREIDGFRDGQIRWLFGWAHRDSFWQSNILSPAKLRKQWDRLILQAKNEDDKKNDPLGNEARAKALIKEMGFE